MRQDETELVSSGYMLDIEAHFLDLADKSEGVALHIISLDEFAVGILAHCRNNWSLHI